MTEDFVQTSYRRHQRNYDSHVEGGDLSEKARSWLCEDTVDSWRHMRMYRILDPLLRAQSKKLWLTVGDGRYGMEAHYIGKQGHRAVASDISDTLLKEGMRAGLITGYSRQNAEALEFGDREFDYVLCKESLHHFPRPFKALYEMIRVAREGVVLMEPTDLEVGATLRWKLFRALVDSVRRITGTGGKREIFEEVGNYVYGISRLEVRKVALGLSMPVIAFKNINDYFVQELGMEKADDSCRGFRGIRRRIALNNLFCRLGLKPHTTTCAILFHTAPSEKLREALIRDGFEVVDLPRNPYIGKGA